MVTSPCYPTITTSPDVQPYLHSTSVVSPNPEGALADLLLVDGDPIVDITLIADPAKNFLVIMKDGKIYKNLVSKKETSRTDMDAGADKQEKRSPSE